MSETRTAVSRSNAAATKEAIERILMNYTVREFLLTEAEIEVLVGIQERCDEVE